MHVHELRSTLVHVVHETMDEAAAMEASSGESGVHMEPAEDDIVIGSDRSQETAFSQTADVMKSSTTAGASLVVKFADGTKSSGSDESSDEPENETVAATSSKKRRYPYGPLFFIMTATAGQRYR